MIHHISRKANETAQIHLLRPQNNSSCINFIESVIYREIIFDWFLLCEIFLYFSIVRYNHILIVNVAGDQLSFALVLSNTVSK